MDNVVVNYSCGSDFGKNGTEYFLSSHRMDRRNNQLGCLFIYCIYYRATQKIQRGHNNHTVFIVPAYSDSYRAIY